MRQWLELRLNEQAMNDVGRQFPPHRQQLKTSGKQPAVGSECLEETPERPGIEQPAGHRIPSHPVPAEQRPFGTRLASHLRTGPAHELCGLMDGYRALPIAEKARQHVVGWQGSKELVHHVPYACLF
jgi:hypothetical protein